MSDLYPHLSPIDESMLHPAVCADILDDNTASQYGAVLASLSAAREYTLRREDQLTGIYNRTWLLERMNLAARDTPGTWSLVFIDLDGLKRINDEQGHQAGNELLRNAATNLAETMQQEAGQRNLESALAHAAVRLSGDEYVLFLGNVSDEDELNAIMERALSNLAEAGIQASFGGRPHRPGESATELLDTVDHLMYEQKRRRKQEVIDSAPLSRRLLHRLGTWAIRTSKLPPPR